MVCSRPWSNLAATSLKAYTGELDANGRVPILTAYSETDLCPVNVHWHLGAEHLSVGEFDTDGMGPANSAEEDKDGEDDSRRLAEARLGFRCHHYDESDPFSPRSTTG